MDLKTLDTFIPLIHNPYAGKEYALDPLIKALTGFPHGKLVKKKDYHKYINSIITFFKKQGVRIECFPTKYGGHATQLAKKLSEDHPVMFVMGGDGTINEVINGLNTQKNHLGIIPFGSSNVLAKNLGLDDDFDTLLKNLLAGETQTIDLGICNGRYFACMAGVGFDAAVMRRASTHLKPKLGTLGVAASLLHYSLFYSIKNFNISIDGEPFYDSVASMIVCNGKYYAGKLELIHDAKPNDGKLHVLLFKKSSLKDRFSYVQALASQNYKSLSTTSLEIKTCTHLKIISKKNIPVHCDAEYTGKLSPSFSITKQQLSVFV